MLVMSISAVHRSLNCGSLKLLQSALFEGSKRNMSPWQAQKEKFLNIPIEEKRGHYRMKDYIPLEEVSTWPKYAERKGAALGKRIVALKDAPIDTKKNASLAPKVSLYRGDITKLEIDCIVNAANSSLLGGGGVDGAIHRAAGPDLKGECKTLNGCSVGEAKISGGYKLPAKFVIHTVGPQGEQTEKLKSCYKSCLKLMLDNNLRTIAFPCIATGIYGYPLEPAAHVATYEVRKHLEQNADKVERVIFCLFTENDQDIYEGVMQSYFPLY